METIDELKYCPASSSINLFGEHMVMGKAGNFGGWNILFIMLLLLIRLYISVIS
jgi:hypothetical protein